MVNDLLIFNDLDRSANLIVWLFLNRLKIYLKIIIQKDTNKTIIINV